MPEATMAMPAIGGAFEASGDSGGSSPKKAGNRRKKGKKAAARASAK
jgi:hypothetical protein